MKTISNIYLIISILLYSCNTKDDSSSKKNQENIVESISIKNKESTDIIIYEEDLPYIEKLFYIPLDSLLNSLNEKIYTKRRNEFSSGEDCYSEITEDTVSNWTIVKSITDCGDNGLYMNRWLFYKDTIFILQKITQSYYKKGDTAYFIQDNVFDFRDSVKVYSRFFTLEEWLNNYTERSYIKKNASVGNIDSVSKKEIEYFFSQVPD